jgi:hypothetical protein
VLKRVQHQAENRSTRWIIQTASNFYLPIGKICRTEELPRNQPRGTHWPYRFKTVRLAVVNLTTECSKFCRSLYSSAILQPEVAPNRNKQR